MSFNNLARKVRNPELPMKKRDAALRSCLTLLAGGFWPTYTELRLKYMTWAGREPSEAQLMQAMNTLEIARNRHITKLRYFERKRIREKMRGQRQPRKKDLEELWRMDIPPDNPAPE